jgi:hypothetical protein
MHRITGSPVRGRVALAAVGLVVLVAAVGAMLWSPGDDAASDSVTLPSPVERAARPETRNKVTDTDQLRIPADGSVPPTSDPEEFATLVSLALFTWDTTATDPGEVRGRLLAVADPTGEESPGLLADLDSYLPDAAAWTHLAQYSTRQWIEITTAEVPAAWTAALDATPASDVAPGTAAVTVTGTRHRAGVWEGDEVTSRHNVAFTVFVVCAPSYPTCHLLRLSELDNPLW